MARSDDDLRLLLADLESDLVERKESAAADKIAQAICAYSNDLPGYGRSGVVFVGATDDGRPSGLAITDHLLLRLADMRDTGKILPLPHMRIATLDVDGRQVAIVEVEPTPSPPVRYEGRVWIRVGPRRAIASADEERRLSERRRAADLTFDARPMAGLTVGELDLPLFEREYLPASLPADVIEENGRTSVERLSALRLTGLDGTPTAAGVLLLGNEPTNHLPGAYLQFLRVDGAGLEDPILDEKVLTGPVPTQLFPTGDMQPAGHVAYQRWMNRIPGIYRSDVLGRGGEAPDLDPDPNCLARLKHYRSLIPKAQDARKPVFDLKPADGAFGGHQAAVQASGQHFAELARAVAAAVSLPLPGPTRSAV